MTDPQPAEATATIASQSIELALTGKPDVKNKWGAGSIRPAFVVFTYLPEGIRAHLYGVWVREDGELTDAPCDQDYRIGDTDEWPDWMAGLAREHKPAARAATLREAADAITEVIEADRAYSPRRSNDRAALGGAREIVLNLIDKPRRVADESQQPEDGPDFVTRVLELFSLSHADAYGDLFWRVDDGEVRLFVNVSDVFAWGGSDCEDITPGTLPELEQAYTDLKAVGGEEFTAELYAARQRGTRPQGAAYPSGTHEAWRKVSALYDACGPERELGLGNPKPAPTHTAAAAQQPKEDA